MTNPGTEAVAKAIADNIGIPYDRVHKNKRHWTETRGMFEGEPRDVNGPFQDHYDDAAQAAEKALIEALMEPSGAFAQALAEAARENAREDRFNSSYNLLTVVDALMVLESLLAAGEGQ